MEKPQVTVVVTPRERFGMARESLESIVRSPGAPFELVYVDAGGPREHRRWLDEVSRREGFRVIRPRHVVSPNEARNLGAAAATTPYVVFIDNDVVCADDWLGAMLRCARETGATVVTPLTCEGWPLHSKVHQAGGDFTSDPAAFVAGDPQAPVADVLHDQNARVADIAHRLQRMRTQLCEFHCVLVERRHFVEHGPLDPALLATREHVDFCMHVMKTGGTVWFEPAAVVTYVFPTRVRPLNAADWRYFLVRWSVDWQARSLERFRAKWGVDLAREDARRFSHRSLGWRQYEGLVRPRLRRIPGLSRSPIATRIASAALWRVVRFASRTLVAYDDLHRAIARRSAAGRAGS